MIEFLFIDVNEYLAWDTFKSIKMLNRNDAMISKNEHSSS